jgi:hypothetical protein
LDGQLGFTDFHPVASPKAIQDIPVCFQGFEFVAFAKGDRVFDPDSTLTARD